MGRMAINHLTSAFKPAWANDETTFRKTRAGAFPYLVGDNATFDDLGFPIGTPGAKRSPWVICRTEIAVIQIFGYTSYGVGSY